MQLQLQTVSASSSNLTMSSRDISEITGKRHDNVRADIEKMASDLSLKIQEKPESSNGGRPTKVFHLTKRETLILISGYSVELRARIIDRWMELEQGGKPAAIDYSDPKIMLGVIGHLQETIAEQGDRLKKLDRLEGAKGSMCISDAAKTLKVKRDDLFTFMQSRRWIFKRAGGKSWLAYDGIRHSGYMEHDDHPYFDDQGRERIATRALVTAKGLVKLAALLEQPLN